jgi:4-amino-4-deoxy-L-arabinose transferase-like glycosyltransferase
MLRALLIGSVRFALYGLLAVVILVALNPGFWSNPITMLQALLAERSNEINIQVANTPYPLITLPQRLETIITYPMIHQDFGTFEPGENERYYSSLLAGQPLNNLLGWFLIILVGVGIGVSVWRVRQPGHESRVFYMGLLTWLVILIIALLTNPLPWQRYYVPLIPIYTLLIGVALHGFWNVIRLRTALSEN